MKATTEITTMMGVRIHSFGGPELLMYEEAPKPQPAANEVLVRVKAAGVNPADWKIREGYLGSCPFPCLMGIDFSGVIEELGQGVENFRVGDEVFGRVANESGSYAEFAVARADQMARKPAAIDHVHAAALPVAALTAWQALFDVGQLEAGQNVLIHAAAGGVGSFAVQFAKWKKAYVIGTASQQNADFVHSLGADEVIDYRATKFEENASDIDLVLDTIGGETQERSWSVLKRGGMLVSVVQPPSEESAAACGARCVFMISKSRGDQLAWIADLVAQGQVKIFVEKTLPLAEARQAQILSQSGHTRGKIVLLVA
jgi:NADPH:quinone reductase-like Zn-dependent oxidoreductase